jgi:predicted outer membrane protein
LNPSFKTAPTFAAKAMAIVLLAGSAAAQTGLDLNPPPHSPSAGSPSELAARFLASAIPNANFIAQASRMASVHSQNNKLRKFAQELAKTQNAVAVSLTAWVNVSTSVVTRSPYGRHLGNGTVKLSAPRLLPDQVSNLQRLSTLKGQSFDTLYISVVREALVQLQTTYGEFAQTAADPELKELAVRELPKVEQAISELNSL